jgi:MFS family permease
MRLLLASNAFVLFVGEASRGLTLSSLAAYAVALSPAGTGAAVLSAGVSLFSLGRLAASFLLGELASRGVSYRTIVSACLLVQILGNLLYALAAAAPASSGGVALFLLARLVLGFGSGTLGSCRAIVGEVTTANVRTREFAWLGFAKYVGYALTPILSIGLVGEWRVGGLTIDTFTAPAWLGLLFCLAALVPVRLYFGSALAPLELQVPAPPQQLELSGAVADPSESAAGALATPLIAAAPQAAPRILPSTPLAPQLRRLLLHSAVLFLWLNFLTKGVLALAEASLSSWLVLLRLAISCSYLLSFFFIELIYHRIEKAQEIFII